MDLVDALAGNTSATSPVELSLSSLFRRGHASLYDAVERFSPPPSVTQKQETTDPTAALKTRRLEQEKQMTRLIASTIPPLEKRAYHLTATDVTPCPRPFARTLEDRVFTHAANPIASNRPVTIGHPYSFVTYIPEKKNPADPKWVVPFPPRRVDSNSLETVVGADQLKSLMEDPELPFHNELVVNVSDSKYSARQHVSRTSKVDDLVSIVRSAGNRTYYQSPPPIPEDQKRPAHRPTWYGAKFSLQDDATWHTPNQTDQLTTVTKKGKKLTFSIQGWDDMLMTGKNGVDMHDTPFRLIRVVCRDESGNAVYKRPLWLLVTGDRRDELSLLDIAEAYLQRFDIEHFFRFGKQKLLLTAAQTPNVETEENWMQLVTLAYVQLGAAKELAQQTPRPWESKTKAKSDAIATPSATQRDFERLIHQFGTPAKPLKRRGKSPGRKLGDKQTPRKRHPVIKKSNSPP